MATYDIDILKDGAGNEYRLHDYTPYTLPIASASTLGGIKVGTGLTIDSSTGVLNATGTSITIDTALSTTSTNPVQNKVITDAFNSTGIGVFTDSVTNKTGLGISVSSPPELVFFDDNLATNENSGFMSYTDKAKLDRIGNTWYGTCSTTASTAAKVVTCSNFSLVQGATISILFSTANTAATPTLNVNSTGAKSIYIGTSTPNATTNVLKWSANTILTFIYDGTYFRYISSISAGTVEPSRGANVWYGTCSTASTTVAKTASINNFVLTKGAIVVLQMTTACDVNGAITLNVNSTGAKTVYHHNAATSSSNRLYWNSGDCIAFLFDGTYWRVVGYQRDDISDKINAEVKAFKTIKVGSTNVVADLKDDTIELVAGDNVTLTPDATNDKITIEATDTTYSNATTSASGLMSSSDKIKLDSVNSDVNVTTDFENADSTWANLTATSYRMIASGSLITIEVQYLTTASAIQITMPYSANCYAFTVCGSLVSNDPRFHEIVAVSGNTLYLPEVSRASFTLVFRSSTQIVPSGGSASGGASYTKTNATLPTSGWSNNSITVNVTGVTASNDVIVAPAPASAAAWEAAGIVCTAQGAGTLTFTRTSANTAALTANVMVLTQG